MSAQKDFGRLVFEVIETMFSSPDQPGVLIHDDVQNLYIFRISGRPQQQSDTISDLAEKAIREVEFGIQEKINTEGGVFYTHSFKGELPTHVNECFAVLERPQRIEFYADTFRKGIANLRKIYGVAHG